MTEDVLEGTFLNGLRSAVRAEVISRRPVGLEDMMEHAQMVEDRDLAKILAAEELGLNSNRNELSFGWKNRV